MRRIQEKLPVDKTIWQPISVPMARFIALEQMARSAKHRSRFKLTLRRNSLRTAKSDLRKTLTPSPKNVSDTLALD